MLRTSELDMAESVKTSDIDVFLSDAAWAVRSTYHTVLKASPGAAIFGRDMLFDIPFIADWQKIGEYRQQLTDLSNARENEGRLTMIIKLVRKYCYRKKVSFALLSPGSIRSLGSIQQSIQMEQSRFTAEKSRKDEHPESKTVHRRSR
jgi:hypothetical protein